MIYPEQEMWFNYRKPRYLKPGAYYYASKYNVPIISCFIEIIDKENAAWMSERDYSQKKEAYEKAYNKKLDYKFEDDDIAGWIDNEDG